MFVSFRRSGLVKKELLYLTTKPDHPLLILAESTIETGLTCFQALRSRCNLERFTQYGVVVVLSYTSSISGCSPNSSGILQVRWHVMYLPAVQHMIRYLRMSSAAVWSNKRFKMKRADARLQSRSSSFPMMEFPCYSLFRII